MTVWAWTMFGGLVGFVVGCLFTMLLVTIGSAT